MTCLRLDGESMAPSTGGSTEPLYYGSGFTMILRK
jgi:hypothetical protein